MHFYSDNLHVLMEKIGKDMGKNWVKSWKNYFYYPTLYNQLQII